MNPSDPQPTENPETEPKAAPRANRNPKAARRPNAGPKTGRTPTPPRSHPMLDQLAVLYPALFGETLRPLKRGIFQDLREAHPDELPAEGLKAALALHTRATRYLSVVASGMQRHDLSGQPVEDLTPEQVHHALIEVFRRRGSRSREDLRPKLRQRILQAFEASGLGSEEYATRVRARDEEVNQLTQDALTESTERAARDAALLRAFEASGKSLNEFADMYGLHVLDANRTLERARARARASLTTSGA